MAKKSKNSLEAMQLYIEGMQHPNPKHYEMVADILDYLTYIDVTKDKSGKIVYKRKRLTPIEKELYRILQRASGSKGCWKTRESLAFEMNCSTGVLTNAKRVLSQSFEQLEGKSLINIDKRYLATVKEGKVINKRPNDFITLNYIWKYNNAFMAMLPEIDYRASYPLGILDPKEGEMVVEGLRQLSIVDKSIAQSPVDPAIEARSPNDPATQEARSPGDLNHTHKKHTPYEESYPPASPYNDPANAIMIYDFMTSLGIYKGEQERLVKKTSERWVYEKVKEFQELKYSEKIEKKGRYLVKMIEDK